MTLTALPLAIFSKTNTSRLGFTLAEVLIVLGIIGLIADMTIPTLISSTQEKVAITKLKKFHSTMESAFRLAIAENGSPENWDLKGELDPQGALNVMNNIAPYLRIIKNCGNDVGCFPNVTYKILSGNDASNLYTNTNIAKAQLSDGSIFLIRITGLNDCSYSAGTSKALQNACGEIMVDIDGFKGKNQNGYDFFKFWFTKNGIIPRGTQDETHAIFENDCQNKTTQYGNACTAWVIYNGNMDYLHCNDLSWNGKKKCN